MWTASEAREPKSHSSNRLLDVAQDKADVSLAALRFPPPPHIERLQNRDDDLIVLVRDLKRPLRQVFLSIRRCSTNLVDFGIRHSDRRADGAPPRTKEVDGRGLVPDDIVRAQAHNEEDHEMWIDHRVEATAKVRPHEVRIALFEGHADLDLARIVRKVGHFDPGTGVRRVGIESPLDGFGIPRILGHVLATTTQSEAWGTVVSAPCGAENETQSVNDSATSNGFAILLRA